MHLPAFAAEGLCTEADLRGLSAEDCRRAPAAPWLSHC